MDDKPSTMEITKILRIDDLVTGTIQNKLYYIEEEVLTYADKAFQIAKTWKM